MNAGTMHRIDAPWLRTRRRTRVARPARLSAAALTTLMAAGLLMLLLAASAHAAVWVIPSAARAFPTSVPGGHTQTISLNAAGNEYEAAQVVLRGGGDHTVTFTWGDGSDPLITANTTLRQVAYVRITRPTTGLHAVKGYYPDPLLPRDFGKSLRIPGSTHAFYLQVHVPYGTPMGDHTATLHVRNGVESVDIPFSLHIWSFGWQRLSTPVAFLFDNRYVQRSVASLGADWWRRNGATVQINTARMLQEYGITTLNPQVCPQATSAGHISATSYANQIAPYLDGLGLSQTRLPWIRWWPWNAKTYTPSSPRLLTYLTEVCRVIAEHGWQDRAYAYIVDEPVTTAQERFAEKLARVAHQASAQSGFRVRFLLTDDPRPRQLVNHPANGFLYDDVDIWATRYYYYFGRVNAERAQQRAGKDVWWYTYVNGSVAKMPNFVIEKTLADARSWGWLMEQWNVQGLLNYGMNKWLNASDTSKPRDPYRDPLSFIHYATRGNGDCSLVYPGYYPRYGLNDPLATPVSSLRLEALRDGLEEREYLRAVKATGADGRALAKQELATITTYPYAIKDAIRYLFPQYQKSPAPYDRARVVLGSFMDAHQQ